MDFLVSYLLIHMDFLKPNNLLLFIPCFFPDAPAPAPFGEGSGPVTGKTSGCLLVCTPATCC